MCTNFLLESFKLKKCDRLEVYLLNKMWWIYRWLGEFFIFGFWEVLENDKTDVRRKMTG
jgi:hypothetical protein